MTVELLVDPNGEPPSWPVFRSDNEAAEACAIVHRAYEKTRTTQSYYDDLTGVRDFWIAAFVAPAGLEGNNLRNVSKHPTASHDLVPPVNDDDERIIREGRWVGLSSAHGSYSTEEWQLKWLQKGMYPDDIESRFHLANLYVLESHRAAKDGNDGKLFTRLVQALFEYLEHLAYARSSSVPAYCRLRGTITPAAIGTKLMSIYQSFGYHIIGWVPQVTAMLVNGAKVGGWPSVEENRGFYADCQFPTFERLSRIDRDGVWVLTHTSPHRETWSKL